MRYKTVSRAQQQFGEWQSDKPQRSALQSLQPLEKDHREKGASRDRNQEPRACPDESAQTSAYHQSMRRMRKTMQVPKPQDCQKIWVSKRYSGRRQHQHRVLHPLLQATPRLLLLQLYVLVNVNGSMSTMICAIIRQVSLIKAARSL